IPEKPISAIYWDGERERFFVKRFLIENKEREELIITEHDDSYSELVSTDLRPLVEVVYRKPRGQEARPNDQVDIEDFIVVKGIAALGNQLTTETVNQLNLLDPLPVEEEEIRQEEEETESLTDSTQGKLLEA